MSTYAIGDIHGCFLTLERLLRRVEFNPDRDRLWSCGDLVNRGPRSAAVLRLFVGLGERATVVLGNHDLHLVALALGCGLPKAKDQLAELLAAPELPEWIAWLRRRPFFVREPGFALVHAGIHPAWTLDEAQTWSDELSGVLRGPAAPALLAGLYRDQYPRWERDASPLVRMQLALTAFTRMRFVDEDDRLDLAYKGAVRNAPRGLRPWYRVRSADPAAPTVLFGHWSAQGLSLVDGGVCLDAGCYNRRRLAAIRLEDGALFDEPWAD